MAKQKRLDLILGAKDRATSVISKVGGAVGGFARRVVALAGPLAAVLSVAGIARFAQRSVQAFFEQEQSVENLRTALVNAGDAGASSLAGLQAFASGLQKVTTQGDEATLALAAKLSTLSGLTGGALADATQQTLGLARATGQGADMMGRAYLNALQGNFSMLERYIPALRATEDATEKMRLVQELAANGFKLMQSDANTARGQLQQMRNSLGDMMELIGARLAPLIAGIAGRVKGFVEENGPVIAQFVQRVIQRVQMFGEMVMPVIVRIRGMLAQFVSWWLEHIFPLVATYAGVLRQGVVTLVEMISSGVSAVIGLVQSVTGPIGGVGNFLVKVKDGIQRALLAIEFGFKNWRKVIALATLKVGLGIVAFGGKVKHFFIDVIPAYIKWFSNNWKDLFSDIFNFTKTVLGNIVTNVVETFKNIPELISGEKSLGDIWGESLAKGFEAKLSELPQVAERQQVELEKMLRQDVGALEQSLGNGFAEFVQKRMKEVEDHRDDLKDFFTFDGATGEPGAGGVIQPVVAPIDAEELIKGKANVELDEDEQKKLTRRQIGIASVDVSQRFFGLASLNRGPAEKTAENTQVMKQLMGKVVEKLDKITPQQRSGDSTEGILKAVKLV